ncbi:ferredoxin--NADP reductase [Noviherbaspirillum sp. CPCC 100848]|uniref:ferredoxin--NADP(+) reductase n=1 Tax=Noviherbaspirillum album TaxID=3080276 RepID=A0ABU6JH28_9BURK|nr:ferredoxin--NADP reductase [Noviherbaspirillum sp. CPCC 100848]MEC4722975.1 ferredoxin--NADP reductase [Noviherbaspirillum sp. CPCC 100848]
MLNEEQIAAKATRQTITGLTWWNDRLLTFTTTRPPEYSFAAGQYARLGIADAHGIVWRAYSMTSSPQQADQLEFYGIIVEGGLFTTRLKALKTGDSIYLDKQCFGFMTPDRFSDGEDLWMMSTGTGIGPYISMLRDPYVWTRFRNLVLLHCVRHADEFAFEKELASLQAKPPVPSSARLQVIRSVTRDEPPTGGKVLHGRLTSLLQSGALEAASGLPFSEAQTRVMMCGNPEMIEDMRRLLHERGMRPVRRALPGHFVTENYW